MKRLRVALVANNIHFRGGMERYCAELVRSLCRDYEMHLFASEVDDVPFDQVTIHPVKVAKKPVLALFLQYYLKSSRAVRFEDFDIVHSIGGITARQNVVTAQYCQYAWGDILRRERAAAEGVNSYHQLMWRLTGFFEKRALNDWRTRAVSANSQATKSHLERFYGTDAARISVIYNGVDAVRFSADNKSYRDEVRVRYGIPADAVLCLFVGEYRRKGLATIIRALGTLDEACLHLLAVGRGNQKEYNELAAEVGISRQVTLAEPSRAIEQVFGAADLFVFPTFYEPFGMVITEAMASGLPVITSRRAGAAELITEGESGLLVENPGDVRELANQIQNLLADATLRDRMGKQARLAVAHYDWAQVADKTRHLYARVAGADHMTSAAAASAKSV